MRHVEHSQGQILALAFSQKSLKYFKFVFFCSEAVSPSRHLLRAMYWSNAKLFKPLTSSHLKNVYCVRETEILVEQQPQQGLIVCDHAGLVLNKFSDAWQIEHSGRIRRHR